MIVEAKVIITVNQRGAISFDLMLKQKNTNLEPEGTQSGYMTRAV